MLKKNQKKTEPAKKITAENKILKSRYGLLQDNIGISFNDLSTLDLAFVHKSYLNENKSYKKEHNERLEFLGDAVLELIVTEELYKQFPQALEGEMTNMRAAIVNGKHLAEVANTLDLGLYLYLSKGEERSGGRKKSFILANTLEALLGAIYLDRGKLKAKKFVKENLLKNLHDMIKDDGHIDCKSKLQEISQEKLGFTPVYKKMSESGPDHQKEFEMGVYINNVLYGKGKGSSKQKAELKAAEAALAMKEIALLFN